MRKIGLLFLVIILAMGVLPMTPAMGQGGDGPLAPPPGTDLPLVEVAYQADFTDATQWPAGSVTGIEFGAVDNGYRVNSLSPDGGIGITPPIDFSIDNFYSEVSFTIETCQVPESALLFFTRLTPNATSATQTDTYVFVLECSGSYRARSVVAGTPSDIDAQGRTPAALEEGSQHVMGVLMVNNSVSWYLDGVELATFDVLAPMRVEGVLALGAQRGLTYTATALRIWSLDSTTANGALGPDVGTTDGGTPLSDDPLHQSDGVGSLIYDPNLGQPGSIPAGFSHPVATLVLGGNQVGMYNTESTAILPFEGVQGSDYYVEVVFATRACTDASLIGLVWRASEDLSSFYAFGVQCDGSYRARLITPDGASDPLASGTVTPPPLPETGAYTLGVYVKGNTVWLYYADNLIGSFSDDTLTEGTAGLLLQSDPATAKAMDIVALSLTVAEVK
ncbi:MAG: hypothetical protein HY862_16850 [Chloroflexi bacterium]|nr:hypothetical protein [Chloroflexota bacterium]